MDQVNRQDRLDAEAAEQVRRWARGERTWAEVEGITFEEAQGIARVGCELAGAGRLEEARVVFEGLCTLNPRDGAVRAALGTVYQKLGRVPEARAEYDAALQLSPDNPVALANRGELRLRAGDRDGLVDLARAIEADPGGETAASRRARALLRAMAMLAAEAAAAAPGQGAAG